MTKIVWLFAGWGFLFGCKPECKLDPFRYSGTGREPIIVIGDQVGQCEYEVTNYLQIGCHVSGKGVLIATPTAFLLRMDSTMEQSTLFLDFSRQENDSFLITLGCGKPVRVKIDEIHRGTSRGDVYVFRFFNTYEFMGNLFDDVVLASPTRGIIGSYVSSIEHGTVWIAGVGGDLLENEIDYSDKRFGRLL